MKSVSVIAYIFVYFALFYLGYYLGFEWAVNAVLFLAWFNIAFSPLALLPSVWTEMAKKERPLPRWAHAVMDIGILVLFVYYSALVTALFWVLRILIYQVVWELIDQEKASCTAK